MPDSRSAAPAASHLLAALRVPTQGRVYNLALVLDNAQTVWPGHGPFVHYTWMSYTQGGRLLKGNTTTPSVGMLTDRVEMPLHAGTHVDALNHFCVDGRLHDGSQASDVDSNEGTSVLGIETAEPFICHGILLDLAAAAGVEILPDDREITPRDLEDAMARQGITALPAGGTVLLHTGWMNLYPSDRRRYFAREPGLGLAGAELLVRAGVRAVGADNSSLECIPGDTGRGPYPVHQALLVRAGIYIFENLVTRALADAHVSDFLFVAVPLRIFGGSGSPVTPLAIV